MTASDPRVGEIQECEPHHWVSTNVPGLLSRWVIQCSLCGAYNTQEMNAYLLAELRDRDEKLAEVVALATDWDVVHEMFPGTAAGVLAKAHGNQLRAAVAAANGGDV